MAESTVRLSNILTHKRNTILFGRYSSSAMTLMLQRFISKLWESNLHHFEKESLILHDNEGRSWSICWCFYLVLLVPAVEGGEVVRQGGIHLCLWVDSTQRESVLLVGKSFLAAFFHKNIINKYTITTSKRRIINNIQIYLYLSINLAVVFGLFCRLIRNNRLRIRTNRPVYSRILNDCLLVLFWIGFCFQIVIHAKEIFFEIILGIRHGWVCGFFLRNSVQRYSMRELSVLQS